MKNKVLIILSSYHHKNTEKVAQAISVVLNAEIKQTNKVAISKLDEYNLIGFGSGVYDGHHHKDQLSLVDKLPHVQNKRAFIFSTTGAPKFIATDKFIKSNHFPIRKKLEEKGYKIIGEFGCRGWNTNSFLKYFGGLNKGHPNAADLEEAKTFSDFLNQNNI